MKASTVVRRAKQSTPLSTLACLLAIALASPCHSETFERYVVTSWGHRDGLPSTLIYAIAQTRDGYLWLGTSDGLVRFDGITFDHMNVDLMLGAVTALHGSSDGSLWVGSASGSVTRMNGARIQQYRLGTSVEAIVEPVPGDIWAVADSGLYRFANTPTAALVPLKSFTTAEVVALFKGEASALIFGKGVALKNAVDGRRLNPTYSRDITLGGRPFRLNETRSGHVWLTQVSSRDEETHSTFLLDRRGYAWVGNSAGLIRTSPNGAKSVPQIASRLIESLFEDREGNVWVGSNNGLYDFRYGRIFSLTTHQGLTDDRVSSVAVTGTAVWVGTQSGLNLIDSASIRQLLPHVNVLTVKSVRNHQIWIASTRGVFRLDDSDSVSKPERVIPQLHSVTGIEEDTGGSIWLLDNERGLYRWRDGLLVAVGSKPEFQPGSISFIRAQNDDTVWIGFSTGGLGIYRDNSFHEIATPSGTATVYDAYRENANLFWLATDAGLYRLSGNTSAHWNVKNGLPGSRILWLRPEGDDWLWLGFSTGIARIRRSDLFPGNRAATTISVKLFDFGDGLLANPVRQSQAPDALDADGKLWLTTSAGLAIVDSRDIEKDTLAPNVLIEHVLADNREVPLNASLRFPPLTRNLEIDYNGLSLSAPHKLQFRYELVPYDKLWQQAGNRKQAFYTNLQPGSYQFHVLAANEDGVWNETGASIGFTLRPAFQQTNTFKILCFAGAVLLSLAIYRFRTQRLRSAWNARLEARLAERTRIAQALHDDLLQSAMGVSLQIELVDSLVEQPALAKAHLQRALVLSRALMQKGREVLRSLRQETRETTDIAKTLLASMEEMQQEGGPLTALTVEGIPRSLNPLVADDLAQIGCQAVMNSVQHAGAKRIEVRLNYKSAEVNLQVVDDGCGINPAFAESGKPGHYGIIGMRERAKRMGGTLIVSSVAGQGTLLTASVPARHAYRGTNRHD